MAYATWHLSSRRSTQRSSSFRYLLWDSSRSLKVSTDTRPNNNISTLGYKLSSPFEWAPFSSDWLPPLLALLLISDGGACRITGPTLDDIFFNQELQNFLHTRMPYNSDARFLWEMSLWLGIALTNSMHLQEQFNQHTRGLTSSQATLELTASSYLQWRYPPRYSVHSRQY